MRPLLRVILPGLAAVLMLGIACQRTFINPNAGTPAPNPTASLPTPLPSSGDRTAVVTRVEGDAEARPDAASEWSPAAEGLTLAEGSQVRTGANGQVFIQFTEGSKVQLEPDTAITFNIFYPDLNSQLTSLAMSQGQVWVLLTDGALDVETPVDIASARNARMSVAYDPQTQALAVTCLQGTCGFGSLFIPEGNKLVSPNTDPEPMTFADYGEWGVKVPEATQLAWLATEAVAQGNATMPVVATGTPTATTPPEAASTLAANQPTPAPSSPTPTFVIRPATAVPFTPIPPAPIIGRHTVRAGETLFCIGRSYGVLPGAIAQANGLTLPFNILPGQTLKIPEVQWVNVEPGPVCAPQFQSPFPGLPPPTETPLVPETTASAALTLFAKATCVSNCDSATGDYELRIDTQVSGGIQPYDYKPGVSYLLTYKHCVDGVDLSGTVTVTSADGQSATATWTYHDAACSPTPTP
jgi:LysM repeat protein